ncbi:MAG TPA: hypothetical protein VJ953_09885 [Saprospiraceae bacterium]|nr:hypothetical protein [Saprospiraceae bacterium]
MLTQLNCPNCSTPVLSEDMNIHKLIAKCRQCHAIFDFDDSQQKPVKRERLEIPLPEGFEVQQQVSSLKIAIKWRKTKAGIIFFTIFTVFWNLVTLPFVLIALAENEWKVMLMISLHLMVGIGMFFYTLALYLNKTYVDVDTHGLTVVSKPINLPFNKNRHLGSRDLGQLYVEQYVASRTNNRPNYAFAVRARKKGENKDIRLIKGLKSEDQALYLEHEIEKFLNIENEWMEP